MTDMLLHVIHQGGTLDGQMLSLVVEAQAPVEVRYPTEPVVLGSADKVACDVYRIENVEDAVPPLRGLMGVAVFSRKSHALPGMVYAI